MKLLELFDKKFVHFMWDENLKYKKGLVHDNIEAIKRIVNSDGGNTDVIDYSENDENPFKEEGCSTKYKFAYYDPNYECKIAYNEGKQIQAKLNGFEDKDWIDVKNPTWESNFIFRIKPEENQKWWVMPKYDCFSKEVQQFGQSYVVEKQEDIYSKSKPPLKSGFKSKEEAEKWLEKYLEEESIFNDAKDDIENLGCNLGHIIEKLQRHEFITKNDWDSCFALFNSSRIEGSLKQVTK